MLPGVVLNQNNKTELIGFGCPFSISVDYTSLTRNLFIKRIFKIEIRQ